MKITGILFWVQDNKISEKFYKKLGFNVTKSDDDVSIVELNGLMAITLVSMRDETEFSGDSMSSIKGKGMYIYINVDNVGEFYTKLLADGIKPRTKPRDWEWGNREFIVADPDGYKLCFWHSISK